jgi:hypothetical protein
MDFRPNKGVASGQRRRSCVANAIHAGATINVWGSLQSFNQKEYSPMSRRFIVAMLGLGLAALFLMPQGALAAEDHIAEAITHTQQAIDHGQQGHADVLATHAEAALTHAEAGEKAKANSHTKEAIKHLKQAINEGKKGNADKATTHAEAAMTHLKQAE